MSVNFGIPYSGQYNATNREGHEHPAPQFGSPTVVWHLGISPHWPDKRPEYDAALKAIHDELAQTYEETRSAFFAQVNRILEALQLAAGIPRDKIQMFDPLTIPKPWDKRTALGDPFYIASPGNIQFVLWWSDSGARPNRDVTQDALRIEVHAGAHRDYVTLSFYLDASNNRDGSAPGVAVAEVRQRILSEVDRVRGICEPRMAGNPPAVRIIDHEVLPEEGVSQADSNALTGASRYLYEELWDGFCKAMGVDRLTDFSKCRVFANFRGLVMSTDGLPEAIEKRAISGSSGAQPFPRFVGNGGIEHTGVSSSKEPNEANAVVKAYWPLVRRVTREADRKEFIACGVMSWRALYITALNCPPSFDWAEEARGSKTQEEEPIRYLLITKGEPHRRQIGRIVERINAMGTMRLIALRDYNIIREASTHIQLRGQELDRMMRKWSAGRAKIRQDFATEKMGKSEEERRRIQDREEATTQALADRVENDLVELSAALDEVGVRAVHGLHFRINRSRYYVCEFESLLESLKVGNIDTWVSYDQFVTRGLKPAFEFIDGVGTRLLGLRSRLQSVLEGIETSALVNQTSATRQNTAELRSIANAVAAAHVWLQKAIVSLRIIGVLVAVVALLAGGGGFSGLLRFVEWLVGPIGW